MRLAQGMPVNMIVLTALALLVLVVVASFFITGMSGAAQQTNIVEDFQAYCNGLCGQMVVAANNANTLEELSVTNIARSYQGSGCARDYGCCTVTLRSGQQVCAEGNCASNSDCKDYCFIHGCDLIPDTPYYFYPRSDHCYVAKMFCNDDNKCAIERYYTDNLDNCNTVCIAIGKGFAGASSVFTTSTCTWPPTSIIAMPCLCRL